MVISRQEPAAALSGLVAKRSLIGLARTDLRFTLDETRALCATQYALPDHVIEQLYSSTDGWAAELTLMLESMRRTGHAPFPFDAEVKGAVFDYFASQIFERMTTDVQETLLATAFLPHITEALAQRLSGNAEAGQLLEALFQRQLFLYRTPHPDAIYQYHALFREFLLTRARRILCASSIPPHRASCRTITAGARKQRRCIRVGMRGRRFRYCRRVAH